ncbi:NfeD family protein [Parahaliea sp. F7430]|uniref:NfeD family protein n=1 Tax=Sediminihaliea albiluteola TaxID=2758564 RepID=A0A7W2TWP6_9GAMM|nr:NfeD family protein [Sediminihaliea albiluteola]MBA6413352.1 NfeD family protein [Sediminihaliea albiluteola]
MNDIGLSPWHLWIILSVLLITAEIFVSGFVLAGLGFAALCAALGHYFGAELGWALLAYVIGALLFFVGIRPFALRTFMHREPSPFGVHGMVGKQVTVIDGPDIGGKFYTVFRDSRWTLESEDDLLEGDSAEIVAVKTSTLVVKRIAR